MPRHELLGGLIQVYRRGDGRHWHCSASIKGRQYRSTTGEDDLVLAKQVAENWYLGLRRKSQAGLLKTNEKTFKQAAEQFLKEYEVITEGHRSPLWVRGYADRSAAACAAIFRRHGSFNHYAGQGSGISGASDHYVSDWQGAVA